MSHSLSELRHLLGDPLLVRSGRGMVLTPCAEALVSPLHTLLMDAERLLGGGATFDPATTARRFVIAAPDFLATLLMPALLDAAAREAPGTSLEIVPSSRRGNAWLLETGDVDLAVGAIVDYWHQRFDEDPAHTWLRNLVKKTARSFGLKERPCKRTW